MQATVAGGTRKSSGRPSQHPGAQVGARTPPGGVPRPAGRPSPRAAPTVAPGRPTTTSEACRRRSSIRSQVGMPAAASSPTITNTPASGARDRKLLHGVDGVGVAAAVELEAAGLQAVHVGDRGLDHGHAIGGRAERSRTHLLPGHVGHREQHPIEPEGVADVDRGHQMPDMGGIEGPSEHADAGAADGRAVTIGHPGSVRGAPDQARSPLVGYNGGSARGWSVQTWSGKSHPE